MEINKINRNLQKNKGMNSNEVGHDMKVDSLRWTLIIIGAEGMCPAHWSRGSVSMEVPSYGDGLFLSIDRFQIELPQTSIQIKVSITPTIHVHLSQLNGPSFKLCPFADCNSILANCSIFNDISASKSLQSELSIAANQSESLAPSRP
jgi:hypothetical protein